MNLNTQLENFKKVVTLLVEKKGEQEAKNILTSSVYLFSMGGNDYFRYNMQYSNSTKSERVAFMQTVVANLTNGFKEIYALGGRKFAIQNVGPLGCLPSTKANHPELNGFKEGKVACCGSGLYNGRNCGKGSYNLCKNPSEYVFFDGGHTTQNTNRQLAELLWSGEPTVTGPYNVKQLFEFP
ncbi:hypothetical protein Pint_29379 [Pistacia integerrima]|uniref:Uncharacterized protein n=1 Tax=Pistacia integerrima TaxID=434235 RepID=A0ACC0X3J4_9ROSI|nr:hypothetical protein Pint_29379 [Pistacia integerrima]